MKAKDLRLGNLVWNNVQNISVEVDMKILSDCLLFEKGHNQFEWHPIPITEDWLIKFGFEFFDYQLEDDDEGVTIQCFKKKVNDEISYIINLIDDGFNEFVIKTSFTDVGINLDLRYVHQLQNLYFALIGKELNVNNSPHEK